MGADWTLHPWRHKNVGGVTVGQARPNSSNVGGITAGQVNTTSTLVVLNQHLWLLIALIMVVGSVVLPKCMQLTADIYASCILPVVKMKSHK